MKTSREIDGGKRVNQKIHDCFDHRNRLFILRHRKTIAKGNKGDTLLMYLKQEKIGDELVPSKLPNQDLAPLFYAHRMYEGLKIERINRIL